MYNNKKGGTIGIIITVVILILLVILSNSKLSDISYLGNAINTIVMPVQNGYTYLKNKISGNTSFFTNIEALSTENEKLKSENSELERKLRELEIIKAENATLQSYMNLTQKYSSYSTIPAYVINRDVSNYSSTLILSVGTKDGVKEGMTVIADKGLVGHVISSTEHTSKVQVIIDSASTVSCTISTTNESIICKGTLENNQILRASYIPTAAELIQGDTVYTSGIGGIYPKGIIIGTIKEIITTSNITDRYATVEPAVDFSKVDTVLIINND